MKREIFTMYKPTETNNPTINTILKRYSLRNFSDTPVSQETIDRILEGAMRAPTAGNMMMYSILHITDQAKKERLVKTCDNQPFIAKSPLVLIFLADMQRWFDYYELSNIKDLCKRTGLEYRLPQESDLLLACCDALIAAQNAVITAEALGLGSCYIGDIMENYEIHREMFDLPPWTFPIAMLCIGYPKSQIRPTSLTPRFPQRYICFQNRYHRLIAKEFEDMFNSTYFPGSTMRTLLPETDNLGQVYYFRKTGSDFSQEMIRSVKVALRNWQQNPSELKNEN